MAAYNKLLPCPMCKVLGESGSHECELTCPECGHSWTSDWQCIVDDDNYGKGVHIPSTDGITCEFADLISPLDDSCGHDNQTATYLAGPDLWASSDGAFFDIEEFSHFRVISPQ